MRCPQFGWDMRGLLGQSTGSVPVGPVRTRGRPRCSTTASCALVSSAGPRARSAPRAEQLFAGELGCPVGDERYGSVGLSTLILSRRLGLAVDQHPPYGIETIVERIQYPEYDWVEDVTPPRATTAPLSM